MTGYNDTVGTRRGRIPNEQKWLEFQEEPVPSTQKTRRVSVWTNDRARRLLGIVQWNNAWRRYAFEPCFPTVYEHECLRHIAQLLEEMTVGHRAARRTATEMAEARYDMATERIASPGYVQDEAMARTPQRGTPRNAPSGDPGDPSYGRYRPHPDDEAAR